MAACKKCKPEYPCSWHGGKVKFTSQIKSDYNNKQKNKFDLFLHAQESSNEVTKQ